MDFSNSKLLKEDEDESMHLGKNVDALNRDIEGKNHSSNQRSATLNNGIGDANTNIHRHHILENTQMKEEPSVLGNQNQKVKQEVKSEPGQLWETPCHVSQASNLQSRNNLIGNEPAQYLKLQKLNSQQAHGVEQPVDPMRHGHNESKVLDLLCVLVPEVDKDTAVQLRNLYTNFKSNRIGTDAVFRCLRDVVGDKKGTLAMSKLNQLQQKRRMATNQSVGAQSKSTVNVKTVPNLERPTSVNGPSTVQGGPIPNFQNNSSLLLNSVPWQGSVTKDQTVGPSSSVVNQESINQRLDLPQKPRSLVQQNVSDASVKQSNVNPSRSTDDLEKQSSKLILSTSTTNASFVSPSMTTQMDSSTMVNFPGQSGTIQAEANVRTTPKMPSVGQKKPRETLGSSQPRPSKKQKVSETDIKNLNDVTALSGVNITEESEQLLCTKRKKDRHVSEASRRVVHEEEERSILQKIPLQRKLTEIVAKNGIKHVNGDVERCLSLCVEERMRGVLSSIIRLSKQRVDVEKCRNRTLITSDIREQIIEMNQKAEEERERKQAEENKLKNVEENETEKEENQSKQAKANKEEEEKKRANVAARAAVGGNDAFLKWQLMAEARKKGSSGPGSNTKKPYAKPSGRRVNMNQCLKKVVRSMSTKDVIAVLETEPQMSKSMLLYRLYNRICSDVQNQEKT